MKWPKIMLLLLVANLILSIIINRYSVECYETKVIAKELIHEQEVEFVPLELLDEDAIPYEPNEPEYIKGYKIYTEEDLDEIYKDEPALGQLAKWLYGYETQPTSYYNITHFIPTWPKYLELEKDIWIEYPETEFYQGHAQICYPKGTKIYFKESENE